MRNITVSVDEETHRLARIRAAELDTSVSALVRGYLRSLGGEDSPQKEAAVDDGRSKTAAPDAAVSRRVKQLYEEAQARAQAVTGRPVRDSQELVEVRRRLLDEVRSDFDAEGIGIRLSGAVDREESYDRSTARLEARLAAAEERGEELEPELAALKGRIEPSRIATEDGLRLEQ